MHVLINRNTVIHDFSFQTFLSNSKVVNRKLKSIIIIVNTIKKRSCANSYSLSDSNMRTLTHNTHTHACLHARAHAQTIVQWYYTGNSYIEDVTITFLHLLANQYKHEVHEFLALRWEMHSILNN